MTHTLGKGEVESSILSRSTTNPLKGNAAEASERKPLWAQLRMNDSGTLPQYWHTDQTEIWNMTSVRDLVQESDEAGSREWTDSRWLYRYFADDGACLYIGITNDICRRDTAHQKSLWRHYAALLTVELFPNRALAEHAENVAITEHMPLENRQRRKASRSTQPLEHWFSLAIGCDATGCRRMTFAVDGRDFRYLAPTTPPQEA